VNLRKRFAGSGRVDRFVGLIPYSGNLHRCGASRSLNNCRCQKDLRCVVRQQGVPTRLLEGDGKHQHET
jgi:hypothetical protein